MAAETMTKEDMRWLGRPLSNLSRDELETALWQVYLMYLDVNSPEAEARIWAKVDELKSVKK